MITLTNSFHNTSANIRAKVGDEVSRATLRRVRRTLCGLHDCCCGGEDGTRGSRYRLVNIDFLPGAERVVVVDGNNPE